MSDPTTSGRPPERADFWTGLVLSGAGFLFAFESWRMPRLEERGIDPMTVPGIVPGVLGVTLFVLGLVLAFRRPSDDRPHVAMSDILGTGNGPARLAIALALNLVYALALVGHLPFWLATFFYLITFMSIFGLAPREGGAAKRAAIILAVSAAATAGIVYLFDTLFFVRLP
jgi:uncharacterized membrane protein YhaH (DUF805 family)